MPKTIEALRATVSLGKEGLHVEISYADDIELLAIALLCLKKDMKRDDRVKKALKVAGQIEKKLKTIEMN